MLLAFFLTVFALLFLLFGVTSGIVLFFALFLCSPLLGCVSVVLVCGDLKKAAIEELIAAFVIAPYYVVAKMCL